MTDFSENFSSIVLRVFLYITRHHIIITVVLCIRSNVLDRNFSDIGHNLHRKLSVTSFKFLSSQGELRFSQLVKKNGSSVLKLNVLKLALALKVSLYLQKKTVIHQNNLSGSKVELRLMEAYSL